MLRTRRPLTYIRDDFPYKILDVNSNASSWEGFFVDVFGQQMDKKNHISNICRPPKNRNNHNQSIELFIEEFSPIIDKIRKNMSHGMIVEDFNINLLLIQERDQFDFFDLMSVNGFLPKITFPVRFAKNWRSLIDQIFCQFPESHINFSSAIIMSMISDHNPCIVSLNLLKAKSHNHKFVKKRKFSEIALNRYREVLMNCERLHQIDNDLSTDQMPRLIFWIKCWWRQK